MSNSQTHPGEVTEYTVEYEVGGEKQTLDETFTRRYEAVDAAATLDEENDDARYINVVEVEDEFPVPEVGEYVELTFEGEHDSQSPIKGRVEEVDTDPDGPGNEVYFGVDNGENSTIQYWGGIYEGEENALVLRYSEFSGSHRLGENADWRVLE